MKTQQKSNTGSNPSERSADICVRSSMVETSLTPAGRAVLGFPARAGLGDLESRFADIAVRRDQPLALNLAVLHRFDSGRSRSFQPDCQALCSGGGFLD